MGLGVLHVLAVAMALFHPGCGKGFGSDETTVLGFGDVSFLFPREAVTVRFRPRAEPPRNDPQDLSGEEELMVYIGPYLSSVDFPI